MAPTTKKNRVEGFGRLDETEYQQKARDDAK